MLKIVLGVVAGFIAWSILWIGSDQVLTNVSPAWYGAHQAATELALANQESFAADSSIMLIRLVISVIATVMSAFLAVMIAGENRRTPIALGILLLIVGIAFQVGVLWKVMPIWFHLIFLALLIPLSIVGGRIKRSA